MKSRLDIVLTVIAIGVTICIIANLGTITAQIAIFIVDSVTVLFPITVIIVILGVLIWRAKRRWNWYRRNDRW